MRMSLCQWAVSDFHLSLVKHPIPIQSELSAQEAGGRVVCRGGSGGRGGSVGGPLTPQTGATLLDSTALVH